MRVKVEPLAKYFVSSGGQITTTFMVDGGVNPIKLHNSGIDFSILSIGLGYCKKM